jgi:pimeloyl-ACP methyl ester carboxylesterase
VANEAERVVVLHGIWMRGLMMLPLARRLRAQGFDPQGFDYASLLHGPAPSVQRLAERLRRLGPGTVHLVGHSLGGLVALETLCQHADLPPGRVVCIGSPLAGSSAARGLVRRSLAPVLGRSAALLQGGLAQLPPGREVGMVAGSLGFGLGGLFGEFDGPNDGTVAVSETRLPGLADHREVPASHSGLIMSPAVAGLVGGFLRTGRFPP